MMFALRSMILKWTSSTMLGLMFLLTLRFVVSIIIGNKKFPPFTLLHHTTPHQIECNEAEISNFIDRLISRMVLIRNSKQWVNSLILYGLKINGLVWIMKWHVQYISNEQISIEHSPFSKPFQHYNRSVWDSIVCTFGIDLPLANFHHIFHVPRNAGNKNQIPSNVVILGSVNWVFNHLWVFNDCEINLSLRKLPLSSWNSYDFNRFILLILYISFGRKLA